LQPVITNKEIAVVNSIFKRFGSSRIVYIILAALIIIASILSETFLNPNNIENLMRQVVGLGFVSIGQTLTILTAGIDLSVGSVVSMASTLTSGLIDGRDAYVFPVIGFIIVLALVIGFLNGVIIVKTRVHPLIVTLGMMSAIQGLLLLYTKQPIGSVPISFDFLAWGKVWIIPFPIILLAIVAAAGIIFLRKTIIGRYVYATGGNEEAARLSGINTNKVKIIIYMMCSCTAAFTGIFLASRMGMGEPLVGERYMLDSIIPVLIGGTALTGGKGGIGSTIAGVFIFIILNNVLNLLEVSSYWQLIVKGAIIIISVALYTKRE
jgi:ribose/xylose/arabinose/galactoside ABC-type transport system permease subunit